MSSAILYRRYAAECVRVAQQLNNPADKATLLQMAEIWRSMAERVERDERVAAQNPESDKPKETRG